MTAHAPHILSETLALTPEDQLLVADLAGAPGTVHQVELDERLTCALALSKRVN